MFRYCMCANCTSKLTSKVSVGVSGQGVILDTPSHIY